MADVSDDALLKEFFAEVSEVERDNEVGRVLSCFKLNPFEHLNLPFDSNIEDVKKQYRKISLMIHPDKCKHPQAKEAFAALAKAQQLAIDPEERAYVLSMCNIARDELRVQRKRELKKDNASKIRSAVEESKVDYETTEDFKQKWKLKVREIMTEQEWRRRKMQMRISEEEGRLKKDEEEARETYKRKREHEQKWEETRENRNLHYWGANEGPQVSSWRDFMKGGKKKTKGELKPPKLKTEDPMKSYVQRPVKKG